MKKDHLVSRGDRRLDVGQRVVLCRGALAGFTGVLVTTTNHGKCLIRMDDLSQEVLIRIDATAVKRRGQLVVLKD
ncbi:MAG TPA: hypothetical protein VFB96_09755 [Pirellulaceae bacterium]|nr:hypothetical protein [Pirellulaceae bacterium]